MYNLIIEYNVYYMIHYNRYYRYTITDTIAQHLAISYVLFLCITDYYILSLNTLRYYQ